MWTKTRSRASSFFVALALSSAFSAMAWGQTSAPPGPGTALPSASQQDLRMPLLMPDDFSLLHLVAWRVEYATPDRENPLLEGDMPWDAGGVGIHGSVFKDPLSGKWRAYLVCTPPEETTADWPLPWKSMNDHKRRLCVFDSSDGVHWTWPELSEVPFGDHSRTNILFPLSQGTAAYASLMIDSSDHAAPYHLYLLREGSLEGKPPSGSGYYRYQSADGYHWQLAGGPISDPIKGDSAFFYRFQPGEYVSYYRLSFPKQPQDYLPPYEDGARRTILRATSTDGITWTQDHSMFLTVDGLDHTDTQYQELVPLRVEGGYLATVTMYYPISQTEDVRIAASRDGSHWWFPDRRAALGNAPLGDYGGGMIWQSQNLVVDAGRLYVYFGGSEGTHRELSDTLAPSVSAGYQENVINQGHHFLPFNTALCRASWQYDRLYALMAAAGGQLVGLAVTKPQDLAGKQLWVNLLTRPPKKSSTPGFDAGYLQVELLDSADKPISGFTRNDCQPLSGDHHALQVKWAGGVAAPKDARKAKFYLKRAFLYGFEFRN